MIVESKTRRVAVDERRHLEPRVRRAERRIAARQEVRHRGLERDALLDERELHLLRVRRERMLEELDHDDPPP